MTSEAVISNPVIQNLTPDQNQPKFSDNQPILHDIQQPGAQSLTCGPDQQSFQQQSGSQQLGNSQGMVDVDSSSGQANSLEVVSKIKSSQELSNDFLQNQKILASLSFNIDDLFKKITSLTEEVKTQISNKPIGSVGSLTKIELPCRKIEPPLSSSLKLIPLRQPDCDPPAFNQQIEQNHVENTKLGIRMFQLGQSLGHGKFGQVLECRHKETGCVYALKKLFKSTIEQYRMADQFLTELQSMKRMNHPNVIKTYTAFTDDYHIFIVSQYALGQQLIKKLNTNEDNVSRIIRQVLEALNYIHGQGVVHRDLKPENIMIDQLGTIKICDFGWSSLIEKEEKMDILCGTLDYVCPEMASDQTYTKEVDLWSVGVLTYELIFGFAPFKAEGKTATFNKVKKLEYEFPGAYRFSSQCIDFIRRLLKPESERMRLEQCLAHPFISSLATGQQNNEQFSVLFE